MKIQERPVTAVKMGTSRQVVIPKRIVREMSLKAGDYFSVERLGEKIVLTPQMLINRIIQESFERSMKDYREGRFYGPFNTADEMIKSLHANLKKRKQKNK
ncbi:MAG TPA: AbrB/MazE/SpoVT family DNA-binding domain-containing protein [Candidatus Paceibacterota bacterium]